MKLEILLIGLVVSQIFAIMPNENEIGIAENFKKNISAEELKSLSNKMTNAWLVETRDNYYYPISLSDMEKMVEEDSTDKMGYVNESRDCDDFSLIFAAHISENYNPHPAIGIVVGACMSREETNETKGKISGHQWNAMLVDEGKGNGNYEVYYLNPGNDEIQKPEDFWCNASEIIWY